MGLSSVLLIHARITSLMSLDKSIKCFLCMHIKTYACIVAKMKLYCWNDLGRSHWGCLSDDGTHDLLHHWPTLSDGLRAGMPAIKDAVTKSTDVIPHAHAVTLEPPCAETSRIFCIGVNYKTHAAEAGRDVPEWPSVFLRHPRSFVGAEANVVKPMASDDFDYEAELAVIIGKPGRAIAKDAAMDYVAGYTCLADNSVRDFQKHSRQVTAGKNFDHSGAIGPWLVTADEAPAPEDMTLVGRLNGEVVQQGSLKDLIYAIPDLIAYISTFTELQPGDIIATGTPEGVGFKRSPPLFMKAGDTFTVEIEGVGMLKNTVVAEREAIAA